MSPDGPVVVHLKDGEQFDALYSDGGGMFVGDDRYETHWVLSEDNRDDSWRVVYQDEIERVVVKATGEEVEFGNPYMPGHPRPQELDDDR
jgi:hypothetical protein